MTRCRAHGDRPLDRGCARRARRIVLRGFYALLVLWDDDSGLEELMGVEDAEEFCRQLLASPSGWGSSTRHMEAVELLGKIHGTRVSFLRRSSRCCCARAGGGIA